MFAAILKIGAEVDSDELSAGLLIAGIVAYLATMVASSTAWRIRTWSFRPHLRTYKSHLESGNYEDTDLGNWLLSELALSFEENSSTLDRKARFANVALLAFGLETVLAATALTVTVL